MAVTRTPLVRAVARDVAALALVVALAAGGYAWYRASRVVSDWQTVEWASEGLRLRLPPDWAPTPAGYADPAFRARRPAAGVLLTVRSWAIPAEVTAAGRGDSREASAVEVWAEGQRGQALGTKVLLQERRIGVAGARGVLQVFEEPREALRYSVVVAVARAGRLYTFAARAGSGLGRADAVRLVRRILRTVEWLPLAAPAAPSARPPGPPQG